ncbi:MAG: hypothetical protein K0S49_1264 [Microbacterium sp.]|nr:hypothetical protein [Microbacterium sp.]
MNRPGIRGSDPGHKDQTAANVKKAGENVKDAFK